MKIYELNRNDRFSIQCENVTLTGTYLGMDGMYAKVMLDGYTEIEYLSCNIEVLVPPKGIEPLTS